MAKICPLSKKAVIYIQCAECEHKVECRAGTLEVEDKKDTHAKKDADDT